MTRTRGWAVAVLGFVAVTLIAVAGTAGEKTPPRGHQVFLGQKCDLCHAVPASGIEARSEKMQASDLLAGEWSKDGLGKYIKQQSEIDGEKHKREFKGSDEELQVLVDWLLEQKAE